MKLKSSKSNRNVQEWIVSIISLETHRNDPRLSVWANRSVKVIGEQPYLVFLSLRGFEDHDSKLVDTRRIRFPDPRGSRHIYISNLISFFFQCNSRLKEFLRSYYFIIEFEIFLKFYKNFLIRSLQKIYN